MQNIYPLFEQNRILKKELLRSWRDYSYASLSLSFREYADGIIRGLEVEAGETEISVGTGIVKHNGFIYLIPEKLRLPYEPADQWEILKLKLGAEHYRDEYIAYHIRLSLGPEAACRHDELEICRFKLRKGAKLRDTYKDFYDMDTEYDTVNLIHADWGGIGAATLSPAVTGYFAGQVLAARESPEADINFAYLCLDRQGAVPLKVIRHYLARRKGIDLEMSESPDKQELFRRLAEILEDIRQNRDSREKQQNKRRHIIVD